MQVGTPSISKPPMMQTLPWALALKRPVVAEISAPPPPLTVKARVCTRSSPPALM